MESADAIRRPTSGSGFRLIPPEPPRLKPGESFVREFWFFSDFVHGKGHHIPGPGIYVVNVTVDEDWISGRTDLPSRDRKKHVRLPPVEIKVPPLRDRDLEAGRMFADISSARWWSFTPWGLGRVPSKDIERLTRMAVEYEDTIYGKYSRFRLALHHGSSEDPRPSRRALDVRRAVKILERLEADTPPENLRTGIWLILAEYHLRLEERERASAWLDRVQGDSLPWSRYRDVYLPLSERLAKENDTKENE